MSLIYVITIVNDGENTFTIAVFTNLNKSLVDILDTNLEKQSVYSYKLETSEFLDFLLSRRFITTAHIVYN